MSINYNKANQFSRTGLKHLHLAGTVWFLLSLALIFVKGLRQAGFNWWIIFSLSGHSIVILFVLVSLYLFALFRGGNPNQGMAIEHPLTSSEHYTLLYLTAPFLGAFAGGVHTFLYYQSIQEALINVALASFGVTFSFWVIADPILASVETFTPKAKAHRNARLEQQRTERLEKQKNRQALLDVLIQKEKENEAIWSETLIPYVPELCELLNINQAGFSNAEKRAAEIAIEAWRLGGLSCMQFLHQKVIEAYQQKNPNRPFADYIIHWWDGIGAWRNPDAV